MIIRIVKTNNEVRKYSKSTKITLLVTTLRENNELTEKKKLKKRNLQNHYKYFFGIL